MAEEKHILTEQEKVVQKEFIEKADKILSEIFKGEWLPYLELFQSENDLDKFLVFCTLFDAGCLYDKVERVKTFYVYHPNIDIAINFAKSLRFFFKKTFNELEVQVYDNYDAVCYAVQTYHLHHGLCNIAPVKPTSPKYLSNLIIDLSVTNIREDIHLYYTYNS